MKNYYEILKQCPLFKNLTEKEINVILSNFVKSIKTYKKGAVIWHAGDKVSSIGIVLNGQVHIETQDYWGNRSIIAAIDRGEMFGEAFFFAKIPHIPVNIICTEDSEIMFFSLKISECQNSLNSMEYLKFINNMVHTLAEKNIFLTSKIEHITKRTTREKLLSFLSYQAAKHDSDIFDISFNRQELADFLSVDRSAMSSELSKLKKSGVLDFYKNHFHLYNTKK